MWVKEITLHVLTYRQKQLKLGFEGMSVKVIKLHLESMSLKVIKI